MSKPLPPVSFSSIAASVITDGNKGKYTFAIKQGSVTDEGTYFFFNVNQTKTDEKKKGPAAPPVVPTSGTVYASGKDTAAYYKTPTFIPHEQCYAYTQRPPI